MTGVVIFDLETTGFEKYAEIIQIAARCRDHASFNVYITPTKPVHAKATEANGLQLQNGRLYLRGKVVKSKPAKSAFLSFLRYLHRLNCEELILVSHNCFTFDMPRIVDLAEKVDLLDHFKLIVKGFNDTIPILRNVLSERRQGRQSFSLPVLVQDYLPEVPTGKLHNARYDTKFLRKLLDKLAISDEQLKQSPRKMDQYLSEKKIKLQKEEAKMEALEKQSWDALNAFFKDKFREN